MRAPRKLPNLANPMMQAALQRHALLLLTGAEWGQFFEVSINQLLSSTIVFCLGPARFSMARGSGGMAGG
jgi:hypothetical protein